MKRWMGVVGVLGLVTFGGTEARAQMGGARGQVVDENGGPVEGATVEFLHLGEEERKYDTETNDKGEYAKILLKGPYRVIVSKEGYQGTYLDQIISMGGPTDLPTLKITTMEAATREAMAPIRERFEKAAELSAAGKLDEAIAMYRELEVEHPNIPDLHFNLGTLYARQEKWPEAEASYLKVVELEPDNTEARVLLADVHKNMGRTEEAVAALEALVAENPDDPDLHYDLGIFYLNARRDRDAFAQFEEVQKHDPDNVDALYLLGTLSINMARTEKAVEYLQAYLEKAPADGQHRDTARALLSQMQPSEPAPQ